MTNNIIYNENLKNKKNILNKIELPNEIIEKILQYIDIKYLFNLNILSKKWGYIINGYIKKTINYYLIIDINNKKNIYNVSIYMYIKCIECYKKKINEDLHKGKDSVYSRSICNKCDKCKYKRINEISIKYIKYFKITIKYIIHNLNTEINHKIINNVMELLRKYKIYNTNIYFLTNDYNRCILIFKTMFEMLFNNTIYGFEAYINKYSIFPYYEHHENITFDIENTEIKKIIISNNFLKHLKKEQLKNVDYIYIVNIFDGFDDDNFEIFSNININIKELWLKIDYNLSGFLYNNIIYFKNIGTLIIETSYNDTNHFDFFKFKERYNINKITIILKKINECNIRFLNNEAGIDEILIDEKKTKLKYMKKYKKVIFNKN